MNIKIIILMGFMSISTISAGNLENKNAKNNIDDGWVIVQSNHTKPLLYAVQGKAFDEAKSLLEQGADPNACDGERKTPLHYAAESGYSDLVELLLSYKANPNAGDNYGNTPLHRIVTPPYTCKKCHLVVKQLLKNGASVNAQNFEYKTPLHLAAFYISDEEHRGTMLKVIETLLEYNANLDIEDFTPQTPRMILEKYKEKYSSPYLHNPITDAIDRFLAPPKNAEAFEDKIDWD